MKIKTILKPVIVPLAIIGIGVIAVAKRLVVATRFKPQIQTLNKLDHAIYKLQRVIFNPYRISNGIRPRMVKDYSFSDVEQCHELFVQMREAKENQ